MTTTRTILATAAALAVAGGTAGAIAADTATQVSVTSLQTLKAGDPSPSDVPGVRALRRGKPIPAGYQLLGRRVEITRGTANAGGALRFTCPGTTRLRSFATTGGTGFISTNPYEGRKATWILSTPGRAGTTTGSVYAVCR